jgi:hypothetical protein
MKTHTFLLFFLLCTSLLSAQDNSGREVNMASEPTAKQQSPMQKFEFLLGDWDLEYKVPKSSLGEAATGTGTETIRRALSDKYVFLEYTCSLTTGRGQAHGIFVWDDKIKIYRYWWFEDSGSFAQATCDFIDDKTLFMIWHEILLTQTFTKVGPDKVILRMEQPVTGGKSELIAEVILTRKQKP